MQQTDKLINKKALSLNIDALYIYVDAFIHEMTLEEIAAWEAIIKELDPNYENEDTND